MKTEAAFGRLSKFLDRRAFLECSVDVEAVFSTAQRLSEKHAERLGCRGFDLLHVAWALELSSELFLTCDENQAALARAEGLEVKGVRPS